MDELTLRECPIDPLYRIVLPPEVRAILGVEAGDCVRLVVRNGHIELAAGEREAQLE